MIVPRPFSFAVTGDRTAVASPATHVTASPGAVDDGPIDPADDALADDQDDAPFVGDDDDLAVDDALDDDDDDDAQAGDSAATLEETAAGLVGDESPLSDDDDRTTHDDDDWAPFDDEAAAVSEDGSQLDDTAFGEIDPVHPLDADDGGQEGMRELDADVDESALPELDADDESDRSLDHEPIFVFPDDTTIGHVETLSGQGCPAIAVHEGRVAFLGATPRILERGASSALPVPTRSPFTAVAIDRDTLVVGTARGIELVGPAGATGALVPTTSPPRALVASHGRTWALVDRSLFPVGFAQSSSTEPPRNGVLAVAELDVGLLALRRIGDRLVLERFRGDDEGWSATDVDAAGVDAASGKRAALAASLDGSRVAIWSDATMAESWDRGETFHSVDAGSVVAVTFAGRGDEADALVLIEIEDRLLCARIDRDGTVHAIHGTPLGPSPPSGAIAWDESRNVAFVGTFDRLYTVGPRRTH